jgi:hypothetical protein
MPIGKTWFQNASRALGARTQLPNLKGPKGHTSRKTLGDRIANSTNGFVNSKVRKAATIVPA